ncbi:YybH family protein [Actinocrispum wychmicini]|uniref:Ketosteroid isomerase-like protein n=1 Tax=Actinocrispum wychmicini TaxID=1213861 RepID=A0A4V2S4X3_9PSEU|nr:nuclear transport factor 2 family protein [Actinocrispum wychmicini]TCO49840.1 ketosteroid isomerase-like protein [Actinocrispum wychmicini]
MTTSHDDPTQVVKALVAAFNGDDLAAIEGLYEPDSVLIPRAGMEPVSGPDRMAGFARLRELGLPMKAEVRHSYIVDGIALLVVDWSIQGTAPDGREMNLSGTGTDVFRRGADGTWRYLIDNPDGGA